VFPFELPSQVIRISIGELDLIVSELWCKGQSLGWYFCWDHQLLFLWCYLKN